MNEEQKWQRYKEQLGQIQKQLKQQEEPQPDLYLQRSLGCFMGGLLGPVLLFAVIVVGETLYPNDSEGGALGYLFAFVLSVPVGGALAAVLTPLVVKWIKRIFGRN